jgi:hypothetical protein
MAHRRRGSRNWARGILATFWILLAGVSGLYLFTAFTDPTLGGQLVRLGPAASGETTSAFTGSSSGDRELSEIKATLRELTQQVAALSAHLKLDVGSKPTTPEPEPAPQAATATPPAAPTEEASDQAEAPAPVEPEPPAPSATAQPEPEPAPAPLEQAAVEATRPASPTQPEAPEAAPKPYEPPAVAVSPIPPPEEAQEPAAELAPSPPPAPAEDVAEETEEETDSPAPAASEPTPAVTESAALDPIALPPAANDGSTRYGIEIGSVASQDGLRPLWREFLTNHAALVAGLQPRRVLAPDKKWRLIAGPFLSAAEAEQACALFKKASRPCEATVYAGDVL